MVKPILHIVYSTEKQWTWYPQTKKQEVEFKAMSTKKKKDHQKTWDRVPHCCDMTKPYFRTYMASEARSKGFEVVWWPIHGRDSLMAVGEAARSGKMAPGSVAFFLHAWSKPSYEKECVPAWDYYPVLNAVMAKNDMLYPHPQLDQMHSEKRYLSSLMPPTRLLHFVRQPNGWKVKGKVDKRVSAIVAEEMKKLQAKASAKGLAFDDVMVKQGLSWGGFAVTRMAPGSVSEFMTQKLLPSLPEEAQKITILLQAKLDIVSELRWCMVDGELRGREWKSLNEPKRGEAAEGAGYQNQFKAKKMVADFVKKSFNMSLDDVETQIGVSCKKAYAEAAADAGEPPLYMRIDMLLDKKGRHWLGERESWGADLIGNDLFIKKDPCYSELVTKMIARTKRHLKETRKRVHPSRSASKVQATSALRSSKRRRIE